MSTIISASTTINTAFNVVPDTSGSIAIQTGATPTTALTLDASQNTTLAANLTVVGSTAMTGYLNAPNTFGFKNRIINGAMMIDQRNNGASSTVNGLYCTVDRFKAGNNTNTGTIQQIASTISGFQNSVKFTAAGSGTFYQFGQQIEYNNFSDLLGQTVTISFWAKSNNSNSGSTALIGRMRYGTTINASVIFSGSATDTSITINTTATKYSFQYTIPSNAGAISVEFALGSYVSGDGFEITGVQLEKGSTATLFDYRPYGTELALCQRYYYKAGPTGTDGFSQISFANITTTTNHRPFIAFPVPMRIAPTSIDYSAVGFITTWGAGVTSITALAVDRSNPNGAELTATLSGALGSSGGMSVFLQNNNSGGYVGFPAEL